MNVNLHHLELFYYTAKAKGISNAVKIIPYGIRQPAISQQLMKLEEEAGTRLFERKPFALTPAGERLYRFLSRFFDNIESELREQLKCDAVIHMDPIVTDDPVVNALKERIKAEVHAIDPVLTIHDFRVVAGPTHTNVIFDVVVSSECKESPEKIRQILQERIAGYNPAFCSVVEIDNSYTKSK